MRYEYFAAAILGIVSAVVFTSSIASLASHSESANDGEIAAATVCALAEAGMTSDWARVTMHVEDGAVFIDSVIWEESESGEYIKAEGTRTVRCGSVAR